MKKPQFDINRYKQSQADSIKQISQSTPGLKICDVLLLPKAISLKLIFIPLCGFFMISIYLFLRGFGSSQYKTTNPAVLELDLPLLTILIIALIFFMMINLTIKLYNKNTIDTNSTITIDEEVLRVDTSDYTLIIEKSKCQSFEITISKFWGLIFKNLYRVGRIKVRLNKVTLSYFFPIRDMEIEKLIRDKA